MSVHACRTPFRCSRREDPRPGSDIEKPSTGFDVRCIQHGIERLRDLPLKSVRVTGRGPIPQVSLEFANDPRVGLVRHLDATPYSPAPGLHEP